MRRTHTLVSFSLGLVLAGCATAGGDGGVGPDADVFPDGNDTDARIIQNIDAGPRIDAMPRPDAAPQCTDNVEKLVQGSFEAGSTAPWMRATSEQIIHDSNTVPVAPQEGNWAAWLGGINGATRTLYQDVVIPPGAINMRITVYRWIASADDPAMAFDGFALSLQNTTGGILESIVTWTNQDTTSTWTAFSYDFLGDHAGQTVRVNLTSTQDGSFNTNFFIDNMSLTVTECQ